jgi:flagellar biosynthetic protein FlhB
MLLVGVCVLWLGGESLARRRANLLAGCVLITASSTTQSDPRTNHSAVQRSHAGAAAADCRRGVVALVAPMMLGGLVFSGKSLAFNFDKLNPLPGINACSPRNGGGADESHYESGADGQRGGFFLWCTGRR